MRDLYLTVVMLIFFAGSSVAQTAVPVPARPGPPRLVNDFAKVLTPDEVAQLEKKLVDYESASGRAIVIVTMDSTGADPDFARKILEAWNVGERDNGKGLVLLVDMQHKKVTPAISDALHHNLNDDLCNRIIDHDIIPAFQQGKYYEGLNNAVSGLEIVMIPPGQLENATRSPYRRLILEVAIILILVAGYFYFFLYKKKR